MRAQLARVAADARDERMGSENPVRISREAWLSPWGAPFEVFRTGIVHTKGYGQFDKSLLHA